MDSKQNFLTTQTIFSSDSEYSEDSEDEFEPETLATSINKARNGSNQMDVALKLDQIFGKSKKSNNYPKGQNLMKSFESATSITTTTPTNSSSAVKAFKITTKGGKKTQKSRKLVFSGNNKIEIQKSKPLRNDSRKSTNHVTTGYSKSKFAFISC
jgi:hypothetical protein